MNPSECARKHDKDCEIFGKDLVIHLRIVIKHWLIAIAYCNSFIALLAIASLLLPVIVIIRYYVKQFYAYCRFSVMIEDLVTQ